MFTTCGGATEGTGVTLRGKWAAAEASPQRPATKDYHQRSRWGPGLRAGAAALLQRRGAGAGPGGRISGSPSWTVWRVTKNTAAVQVGNRSKPGSSSAAKVGRKAQCQPSRRISRAATTTSRAVSAGEKA